MPDLLIALLESLGARSSIFLLLLVGYAVGWLWRHNVRLEIDDDACSTSVDFQAKRVYRSIIYRAKYPKPLAFLSLWLHDLNIELPRAPQFIQVERVGYIHPGQDPLRYDDLTEFSELGKLMVDSVVDAEGARQRMVRQIVPKAAARKALGRCRKVLWFHPVCRLKDVDIVVMDIWYPLEEMREDLGELVEVEDDPSADGILRFVIRKKEHLKKVYGYRLRYQLPRSVKSFDPRVEYQPLEARLPVRPQDMSVISTCPLDCFDRDTPAQGHELDWMFDISHDAIEVRLRYNTA